MDEALRCKELTTREAQPIHHQQAGCREIFASISPRRNEIAFRVDTHSRSTHEELAGTLDASIRRELACRYSCLLHRVPFSPLFRPDRTKHLIRFPQAAIYPHAQFAVREQSRRTS